jgi:magnesium-transporting ATPase (P-type)
MVTGDNVETAKAIALECGILNANDVESETIVIEGKVFREMSESARQDYSKPTSPSLPLSRVWSFQNYEIWEHQY